MADATDGPRKGVSLNHGLAALGVGAEPIVTSLGAGVKGAFRQPTSVQTRLEAPGHSAATYCWKRYTSLAEEIELLPAYMVYFGGCNLRCRFCIEAPECFDRTAGELVDPQQLAVELQAAVAGGARSVMLLGGEPSLHVQTIVAIAEQPGPRLPLVLKSNMIMKPQSLTRLQSVVSLCLADFKFGNDACAWKLARARNYWAVVTENIRQVRATTPVWIRHLLMPGHVECCFRPVADWAARQDPPLPLGLMTGYVPAWQSVSDPILGRTLLGWEVAEAQAYLKELGLDQVKREW